MSSRASARRPERPGYRCQECGWTAVKWTGRCGECQAWGTVSQLTPAPTGQRPSMAVQPVHPAVPIGAVDLAQADRRPCGVPELDRVLGGGLVPGEVVLVAGEPGVGKSTLLLDAAAATARSGLRVLYVSAEESAAQVRLRAQRIGAITDGLLLASETDLAVVLGQVGLARPDLLVVDSVQTLSSSCVDGAAGNVAQVREVTSCLIQEAKSRGMATLLVGHVTKDGSVAGPRTLEHLVDAVLHFEGDRHVTLRLVRAVKNRYGPTDEVGCFEMSEAGVISLADPTALFLSSRAHPVPGTCVTVTVEGRRPLLTEVQALLARTASPAPRRTTSGIDSARVAMLLAVLERHAGIRMRDADCYVSTVGGVRISEPSADLAVALAMAGSVAERTVPAGTVAIGEVGLAGEIRPVAGLPRRLAEAARLGFTAAVVPAASAVDVEPLPGLLIMPAADVTTAVRGLLRESDRDDRDSPVSNVPDRLRPAAAGRSVSSASREPPPPAAV